VLPPSAQDLEPVNGITPADPNAMEVLTSEPDTRDVDPAVSPDGSTVAFVRKDATAVPPSLWLVDIDGTHEHAITRAPGDVQSPTWSPDGSLVAFSAAYEPEGRAVYTIHPDGSDLQLISQDQGVVDIAWSPDGTSIVYSGTAPGEPVSFDDLWVVSLDGSDPRRLTQTPDLEERDPTWSPDGSAIAFASDDGIREMPSEGGESQVVVPWSLLSGGRVPARPAWSPDGAYLTFVFGAPSPLGSVVFVLPTGATDAFPLTPGSSFAWQPVPIASPTPSIVNLGLDFPICRVMSMPITVSGTPGTASVFTRAEDNCPKAGEGTRFVAADLNGDGVVDTPPVQLDGCFPPVGCEAFAAPDVNGDVTSEIAVSNAGADGYGVSLFTLTTSPPSIVPIDVVDPQGIGYIRAGRLEFAWVDVAGHAEGARCESLPNGWTFTIFGVDKLQPKADVRSTVLRIDGSTATVIDASREHVALSDAPVPGNELCSAPLQGSAANFPGAAESGPEGDDIGLASNVCQAERLGGLHLTAPNATDTVWSGYFVDDAGACPIDPDRQHWLVAVDRTGDGLADFSGPLPSINCTNVGCSPLGATDLDADGDQELIVVTWFSVMDHMFFSVDRNAGEYSIAPILVAAPGHPEAHIQPGEPLQTEAGGDEGFDAWIRCEGYPAAPVLVYTWSNFQIETNDPVEWHETKLRLEADGMFHVVDSTDLALPQGQDPGLERSVLPACGVDFDRLAAPNH
jgi:WD40-like Beta Propeller Repeat